MSTTNSTVVLRNRGRPLNKLSPQQARRKLKQLKANAESVLWFAESFGMIPTELHLKHVPTGIPVTIQLSPSRSTDTASSPSSENGDINDGPNL